MRAYLFPILLQVIGFLVVVAEVFIPSMGILSILALAVISYSLYLLHTAVSAQAFWVFLAGDLLILPLVLILGLKLLARSPLSLKKELSSRDGVVSPSPAWPPIWIKPGKRSRRFDPRAWPSLKGFAWMWWRTEIILKPAHRCGWSGLPAIS